MNPVPNISRLLNFKCVWATYMPLAREPTQFFVEHLEEDGGIREGGRREEGERRDVGGGRRETKVDTRLTKFILFEGCPPVLSSVLAGDTHQVI